MCVRARDYLGRVVGTHSRLDRAFPVEEAGILICNREALDGEACERQESEWVGWPSDLPR